MDKEEKKSYYFALIGAAGYVAPRHMRAIKESGNKLLAAVDKNDSVGIIDSYFPEAAFFTEFERFDRHLEKLKERGQKVDFISICSPNYLHDAHIRFALRYGANVICEKPLVLNPWNIGPLQKMERASGKRVYNILQLRLHKSIVELKQKINDGPKDKVYDIDLTYITSRGNWYYASWKGDESRSGGIATNIGIHFFDMLLWIFGDLKKNVVHLRTHDRAAGYLELERARVKWFLSINGNTLPTDVVRKNKRVYRSLKVDGLEIEFSEGFEDLHSSSYKQVFRGDGFEVEEVKDTIDLVFGIRGGKLEEPANNFYHPLSKQPLTDHPFS